MTDESFLKSERPAGQIGMERTLGVLVVLAFYHATIDPWQVASVRAKWQRSRQPLVARLAEGALAMDVAPGPILDAMANPYDLAQRGAHRVHDASHFRSRHYLYFGAAPALLSDGPASHRLFPEMTPDFHVSASPARIGVNAIGASTSSPCFSGRIVSATRE